MAGEDVRGKMPVNVAVEEPRSWVVGVKADGRLIAGRRANVDDIATDGIGIVIGTVSGTANHRERVLRESVSDLPFTLIMKGRTP